MQALAFLTQHDKLPAVAGALQAIGFETTLATGVDTDTLGTFTGECARQGSQLDAALRKAKLACELSNTRFGLGSEGSFGPDPYMGVTAWGIEVLALWDCEKNYAVHTLLQGPDTNFAHQMVDSWQQAQVFTSSAGFPEHGVIVGKPGQSCFDKTLTHWQALEDRVMQGLVSGPVWLETDMRAHRNPSRMAMIAKTADALAQRMATPCPACSLGGFGAQGLLAGALCSNCQQPTQSAKAQILACNACHITQEVPIRTHVPPERCQFCNP
jgi:hypothetical protein